MATLYSFNDLARFGIGVLTGEACNYQMRLLCDLTAKGVDLLNNFLGVDNAAYGENWNSSVGGEKSIAAVFLTRGMLSDLCVFALLHVDKAEVVLARGGTFMGLEKDHPYFAHYEAIVSQPGSGYTVYRCLSGHPASGGSNEHAMTGRTQ